MNREFVYIASPFRGATVEETRQNILYARFCMLDAIFHGQSPYLSHLLITQVFDESPTLRDIGLSCGDAAREACARVALYVDLGVTDGMKRAEAAGKPTERRTIPYEMAGASSPLISVAAWRDHLRTIPLRSFPAIERM